LSGKASSGKWNVSSWGGFRKLFCWQKPRVRRGHALQYRLKIKSLIEVQ
jgi:hypothetical protein